MPPRAWMLEHPASTWTEAAEVAFRAALAARDAGALPRDVPRRAFLEWLTGRGFVLHGSAAPDIEEFEPRAPNDRSPDEFSKRTAVFAASDALWALMYALVDRARVRGMLNSALQVWTGEGWSPMYRFLSLAPKEAVGRDGRVLLRGGSVYVLPAGTFDAMPPYDWPGLGLVREPHWASAVPVRPVLRVPVTPEDFPLPVRTHDAERVNALARLAPWAFPWLDGEEDAPP